MRLKIIKIKFTIIIVVNKCSSPIGIDIKRIAKPKIVAIAKLLIGPASETVTLSSFGFLKLFGLTITGLPQPKTKGDPMMIRNNGRRVPTKSRWTIGFRDTLPINLAVGSPNWLAIWAWKNSWMVRAIKKARIRDNICKAGVVV